MKFEGSHEVDLEQEALWRSLHDPSVLAASIPGCESLERLDDEGEAYHAVVATRVGPIKARFDGKVAVKDTEPPNTYQIEGSGKAGAAGSAKGRVDVTLEALSPSRTRLDYDATVAVTGRMAQVGGKMLKGAAEAFAAEFFVNLAANAAPQTARSTTTPAGERQAYAVPAGAIVCRRGWLYVLLALLIVLVAAFVVFR